MIAVWHLARSGIPLPTMDCSDPLANAELALARIAREIFMQRTPHMCFENQGIFFDTAPFT